MPRTKGAKNKGPTKAQLKAQVEGKTVGPPTIPVVEDIPETVEVPANTSAYPKRQKFTLTKPEKHTYRCGACRQLLDGPEPRCPKCGANLTWM